MLCLTTPTDPRWVELAVADVDALLVDHAHCEMKAASNALSLAARASAFPRIVRALVSLASEELAHFDRVLGELDRRGVALGKPPSDDYAVALRRVANQSRGNKGDGWLVDRLLVGALIEARSCERFRLLADALPARAETELARFYDELLAAEARHFRELVDLAAEAAGDEEVVRVRLVQLARAEGELCDRLGTRATIHG